MNIIKLNSSHADLVKSLFYKDKFMGKHLTNTHIGSPNDLVDLHYLAFQTTYLTDLVNYHAYGAINNDGVVQCYIGFYESIDDASWYWNQVRTTGNGTDLIKHCLDAVIKHNEEKGKLKFYSMFPAKYTKVYRRLAFSTHNSERYDSFDEYTVKPNNQCIYTMPWQILYNRTLTPVETVVRCSFLKQQYRTSMTNGGNI